MGWAVTGVAEYRGSCHVDVILGAAVAVVDYDVVVAGVTAGLVVCWQGSGRSSRSHRPLVSSFVVCVVVVAVVAREDRLMVVDGTAW